MLPIPSQMQARLDGGATTLCWCWRVTRKDGAVFGFTEHDRDLAIGGLTFRAASGLSPGAMDAALGFAPAQGAVHGAFDDAAISEADLANGLWDGARVEILRADWTDPALNVRVFTGELGETRRGEHGFEADLLGLSQRLNRAVGRVFARRCDAELGDARCGVDLGDPAFHGAGAALRAVTARRLEVSGLSEFAGGWFAEGRLSWTSGANAGAQADILTHQAAGEAAVIELAAAPAAPVQAGDAFTLVAGCDKRLSTCRDRFANVVNFRGCPFIPGNDVLVAHPSGEARRDGGSRGPGE